MDNDNNNNNSTIPIDTYTILLKHFDEAVSILLEAVDFLEDMECRNSMQQKRKDSIIKRAKESSFL